MSARARVAIVVLAVLAIAALARWGTFSPGPVEQQAPAPPGEAAAAFGLASCEARLLDDRPALAVTFSQPLDRRQALADAMRVVDLGPASAGPASAPAGDATAPARVLRGGWTIGDNARTAWFPYIQPQRRFRVEVGQAVRSADGTTLGTATQCELASDTMAPSWFFASRGVVLPAGQNGGLPIVTVNQPEVDVQFLRVDPASWPRFFERVAGARRSADEDEGRYHGGNQALQGRVGGWELDQLRGSAQSVYLGRFRTTEEPNRRAVTFLPVQQIPELREPGVYIAVMAQPGRFGEDYQVTYFYVSDIGVHVRRYGDALEVFATSLQRGRAMTGVAFELLDENARALGRAVSDAQGRASFADVPDSARLLVAQQGGEMSVIVLREPGLDLSEFDVGGHMARPTKLFVYAGRDLYRPGEALTVSVLARDADGRPTAALPLQAQLKRPDGRTVRTMTWSAHAELPGYFEHALALPPDAPTGAWQLELRADPGARQPDASWRFHVEEFLPERMKLALHTDAPLLMPDQPYTVAVQGDYLFGSPAAGNRLLVSTSTERLALALPGAWPGFVFGDVADDTRRQRAELPETTLDEHGRAEVTLPVAVDGARSPMLVRGSFSLLESGGRPVARSIERAVWPAPQLLAVRPLFDRDVTRENGQAGFELIRVDAQGRFAPLDEVAVRLVREERHYHWRFDDQRGWHAGYAESDAAVDASTTRLHERTTLNLPVQWGRYRLEVDDPETGLTLRYRFYAGWNAQDMERIGNRPDRVQIALARTPLRAGDLAQLTLTPPHDGTAIVTVEGDRLLWSRRVDVSARGTQLEIPIDVEWARHDLYVTVTAFRPGSRGERVTPARAVGLAHLPLARDERRLQVAIDAPAQVRPEQRTQVTVKAEGLSGGEAFVTLSAVDVGILQITRYASPDPVDFFFGKHRYAPEMMDIYGKLIEAMEGSTARLAYGGDTPAREARSLPSRVRLVDLFSGPVRLDAQGRAEIALDIPDFNGTMRLMAVVAGPEQFGSAQAEMVSAAPVIAELAMPRFISPGDAATLALDLTNRSGVAQDLRVQLQAEDPVRIGDGDRTLTLADGERVTLQFPVEATDAWGLGLLRLGVQGADGLDIRREAVLQVQPPVALMREVRRVRLAPGEQLTLDPAWAAHLHPGSATVSLALSDQPPLNVRELVRGLLSYPYGCLEQTTSAAYPHLFVDEAGARAAGLAPLDLAQRTRAVEAALGRIAGLQRANGGYSLWGSGPYEVWLTAYVAGFLQDARAQGFDVPDAQYRSGQEWLLQQLQQAPNRFPGLPASARPDAGARLSTRDQGLLRDSHQRFAELAHVGYVLARDQRAPLAMLRYLHDEMRDRARSPLPLVHLALALHLMGDAPRAEVALNDAMTRPYGIRGEGAGHEWLGDYGSPVRDMAMAYALLMRHDVAHPRREQLLFDTAARLGSRPYLSTQERLAVFLAARAAGGGSGQAWAALLRAGTVEEVIRASGTEQRSIAPSDLAQGTTLVNRHDQALFVEVDVAGYPREAPAAQSEVIKVQRDWFDAQGQPWPDGRAPRVGDMLIVRVQVQAQQLVEDGLVVDRIPAGFEVENLNLSQGARASAFRVGQVDVAQAMADPRIKHREYRDDRFVAAARLDRQPLHLFYLVRAVSPGRYVVPAPFAEDMYRPELRGVGAAPPPVTITDPRGAVVAR